MNIAVIIEKLQRSGGMEKRAHDVLRRLSDEHAISVFVRKKAKSPILVTEHFWTPDKPKFLAPLIFFLITRKMTEKLKEKFDVIQSFLRLVPGCDICVSGRGSYEAARKQVRFYPLFKKFSHYTDLYGKISAYLDRKIVQEGLCKILVLNSETAKKQVLEVCKPRTELFVIRNWVDLEEFSPELRREIGKKSRELIGIDDKDFLILFSAGSKFIMEGFQWTVRCIEKLDGVKLVVAGRKLKGYYKWLTRNVRDKIIPLGHQKDLRWILSACDLFIRPSIYETFSTTCAEAMAMGVPVAVSEFNGVSEIIEDGKNGFVIEKPYDVEIFAEKLRKIMKSNLENVGYEARRTAEKYLSLDDAVMKFNKLYAKIAG